MLSNSLNLTKTKRPGHAPTQSINRAMSSEEATPATPAEEPKAAEDGPKEEAKPTNEEEEKVKEEESTATFEPVVSYFYTYSLFMIKFAFNVELVPSLAARAAGLWTFR